MRCKKCLMQQYCSVRTHAESFPRLTSTNARFCYFISVFFFSDIDECSNNLHDCGEHSKCANEPGSYKCTCADGYAGDGKTCTGNVNEKRVLTVKQK